MQRSSEWQRLLESVTSTDATERHPKLTKLKEILLEHFIRYHHM